MGAFVLDLLGTFTLLGLIWGVCAIFDYFDNDNDDDPWSYA